MKKVYSEKVRESRKSTRNILLILLVIIALTFIVVISDSNDNIYTAEELLHDHDGDGIPDH